MQQLNTDYKNQLQTIKQYYIPGYIFLLTSKAIIAEKAFGFFLFLAEIASIFTKTQEATLQLLRIHWWREAITNSYPNVPLLEQIKKFNAITLLDLYEMRITNDHIPNDIAEKFLQEFCNTLNIEHNHITEQTIYLAQNFLNKSLYNHHDYIPIIQFPNNPILKRFCYIMHDILKNPTSNRFRPWFILKIIFFISN